MKGLFLPGPAISNMRNEPRKLSAGLNEYYWKTYLDFRGFWSGLPTPMQRALLDCPLIKHAAESASRDGDAKGLEIRSDVDELLGKQGIPSGSQRHHLLVRLYQVAAACPSTSGNAPLSAFEEHLKWLQFSKASVRHFSLAFGLSRFSMFEDFSGPLELDVLSSGNRIRRFLEIPAGESGARWEAGQHQARNSHHAPLSFFSSAHVTACAQGLLRPVFESRSPVELEKLIAMLDADKFRNVTLVKAIAGIVLWGFVLLDYATQTGELRLRLWPGVVSRLEATHMQWASDDLLAPPVQAYSHAFAAGDMAVIVAAAAATPLRLKQGKRIEFLTSVERSLAKQLEDLPLHQILELSKSADPRLMRIQTAIALLLDLGFLHFGGPMDCSIHATRAGVEWLELSPSKRLQRVMELLRSARFSARGPERFSGGFCPLNSNLRPTSNDAPVLDMEDEICAAWRLAPAGFWLELGVWMDWLSRQHNPILKASGPSKCVLVCQSDSLGRFQFVERDAELLHPEALRALSVFFVARLLPLGGVRWGLNPEGRLLFQITTEGRYYLGQLDTFPASTDDGIGKVVLQPNFELVFLGANLAAEAKVSAFCERLSHGSGSLFKITKASLLKAIQSGTKLESIFESLEAVSSKGIPENVRTEITSWVNGRRTFRVRTASLLTCPDPQVALRVHGILKKNSVLINDTTMELTQPLSSAQRRKLEASSLFLED